MKVKAGARRSTNVVDGRDFAGSMTSKHQLEVIEQYGGLRHHQRPDSVWAEDVRAIPGIEAGKDIFLDPNWPPPEPKRKRK